MGTRGAVGFRIDNEDKITYNHWDSYPDALGRDTMEALIDIPIDVLRATVKDIILVSNSKKPTAEQIEECKQFADLDVSEQSIDEWYCLLRKTQGNISVYLEGKLKYMIDNKSFLHDSLFCEWAYIINLDTNTLEVYEGFNKNPDAKGRYAKEVDSDNSEYRGVTLVKEIPLDKINSDSIIDVLKELDNDDDNNDG